MAGPYGDATYAYLSSRSRTTTNFTPEQIHEIGLQEVKRIGAEMKVREQSGLKGTNQEFFHFLRTDPRFYAKTSGELLINGSTP